MTAHCWWPTLQAVPSSSNRNCDHTSSAGKRHCSDLPMPGTHSFCHLHWKLTYYIAYTQVCPATLASCLFSFSIYFTASLSQDRPKLLLSFLMPFYYIFLGHSLCHHTMLDPVPVSITFTFHISKPSQSMYMFTMCTCLQSKQSFDFCTFLPFF